MTTIELGDRVVVRMLRGILTLALAPELRGGIIQFRRRGCGLIWTMASVFPGSTVMIAGPCLVTAFTDSVIIA